MGKDKTQPRVLLERIAAEHGVSVEEVERDIQSAIDATWNNPDPAAKEKQDKRFPKGKPSIEEFIRVMAGQIRQ